MNDVSDILPFPARLRPDEGTSATVAPYGDETQQWITGYCMLRCNRVDVAVMHVGDVAGYGLHLPLWACSDCIQQLRLMLMTSVQIKDGTAPPDALHTLNALFMTKRNSPEPIRPSQFEDNVYVISVAGTAPPP